MTVVAETPFTDGEWHRLHPATPFLRGGISLVAIIGIVFVNARDFIINTLFGRGEDGDPVAWLAESGYGGFVALAVVGGLAIAVAGFYVSWRMHTFRITDEVVEVRSGILFRTNRKGRLDRIQGINIQRPFLARLFGAARLEVNVAGHDANVQLSYLGSTAADDLRRDILRLASGTRAAEAEAPVVAGADAAASGLIDRRVSELLAPELDPNLAPRESVVELHTGRLIGSLLLSDTTLWVLVFLVGSIVTVARTGELFFVVGLLPVFIGFGSFYVQRVTKSLRYSIAGTTDGVRIGFGLFSTSNETLPPGRIHSVQVSQPLLWRTMGWWEVRINRASKSNTKGAAGQANTTILPVGNLTDVKRVLELVLPALTDAESVRLIESGLVSKGGDDGFANSPRRAAVLRWFSWRRNGFALVPDAALLRTGVVWRKLVIVPLARAQSVSLRQGPLLRRLRLAGVHIHTVAGPVSSQLGAIDADVAIRFFGDSTAATIAAAGRDTSHRWGAGAAAPVGPVAAVGPVASVASATSAASADSADEATQ